MRLASLCYDTRKEEGVIKWGPNVDLTEPDVVMLDILKDWIHDLETAYEALRKITFYPTKEN
jgi:hypothetical protein